MTEAAPPEGVGVVLSCAGIMRWADAPAITPELWDEVSAANVEDVVLCSQAAARSMIAHGRGGAIVFPAADDAALITGCTIAVHGGWTLSG